MVSRQELEKRTVFGTTGYSDAQSVKRAIARWMASIIDGDSDNLFIEGDPVLSYENGPQYYSSFKRGFTARTKTKGTIAASSGASRGPVTSNYGARYGVSFVCFEDERFANMAKGLLPNGEIFREEVEVISEEGETVYEQVETPFFPLDLYYADEEIVDYYVEYLSEIHKKDGTIFDVGASMLAAGLDYDPDDKAAIRKFLESKIPEDRRQADRVQIIMRPITVYFRENMNKLITDVDKNGNLVHFNPDNFTFFLPHSRKVPIRGNFSLEEDKADDDSDVLKLVEKVGDRYVTWIVDGEVVSVDGDVATIDYSFFNKKYLEDLVRPFAYTPYSVKIIRGEHMSFGNVEFARGSENALYIQTFFRFSMQTAPQKGQEVVLTGQLSKVYEPHTGGPRGSFNQRPRPSSSSSRGPRNTNPSSSSRGGWTSVASNSEAPSKSRDWTTIRK